MLCLAVATKQPLDFAKLVVFCIRELYSIQSRQVLYNMYLLNAICVIFIT
jgi:hypothetical protein